MTTQKDVITTEVNDGCKHSQNEEIDGIVFCIDCGEVNEDDPVVPQHNLIDKLLKGSDGKISCKALTLVSIALFGVNLAIMYGYDKYNEYTAKERRKNILIMSLKKRIQTVLIKE